MRRACMASPKPGAAATACLIVRGPGAQQAPAGRLPQVNAARRAPARAVLPVQGACERQDRLRCVAALQHRILHAACSSYLSCECH
jgi:hypothetical protein